MGTKVQAAPERNYAQETRDNLQAQIDLSPKLLKAEQDTRPGYTALELATANDALWGTGGQPGLIQQYKQLSPEISAMDQAAQRSQREADIQAVKDLGPEALAALKAANPQAFQLLDQLTKTASEDLAAGSGLSASDRRLAAQTVRGGQAARGLSMGPAEVYQEALATNELGSQRLAERFGRASQAIGLNQAVVGDPYLQILGRPSNNFGQTQSLSGQGSSMDLGPDIFNPESQYGADIASSNQQNRMAANIATAKNRAGLFGGILGSLGQLGGAAITKWG